MAKQLYRAVKTFPPTRDDFLSNAAKGKAPINSEPEVLYTFDGISTFTPWAIAQKKALRYRRNGAFLAELLIPDDATSVRYERTFALSEGHYTVWGNPDDLLALVVSVHPVETSGKD